MTKQVSKQSWRYRILNGNGKFYMTIGGAIATCVLVSLFFYKESQANMLDMEKRHGIEIFHIRECLCEIKDGMKEMRKEQGEIKEKLYKILGGDSDG